jgi:uncharacterized membrane protein YobD (UPF0266 family)
MNDVFGPMSANYCNVFLILSAISLVITIMLAGSFLMSLTGKTSMKTKAMLLGGFGSYLFNYITYRLLYNMCVKSA